MAASASLTQVVGGLIEDHHVGLGVGEAGEGYAGFLASRHELHGLHGVVTGDLVAAQVRAELSLYIRCCHSNSMYKQ